MFNLIMKFNLVSHFGELNFYISLHLILKYIRLGKIPTKNQED